MKKSVSIEDWINSAVIGDVIPEGTSGLCNVVINTIGLYEKVSHNYIFQIRKQSFFSKNIKCVA